MPAASPASSRAATVSCATFPSLSPAQRQLLEERLLEERARILRSLSRYDTLRQEDGGGAGRMPQHLAELGTETMQATIDGMLASQETRTLAEIDGALRRLYREPERFGLDEVTGEPIAFARLEILPWARRASAAVACPARIGGGVQPHGDAGEAGQVSTAARGAAVVAVR